MLGGAIGNTVVGYLIKKYKKTWFVVALLSAILALSTVLMGYAGYERYSEGIAHGKSQGIRALCPMKLNPNLLYKAGTTAAARAAFTHHLAYMSDVHSPAEFHQVAERGPLVKPLDTSAASGRNALGK